MRGYSQRYESALALAARAHRNQVRKVDNSPYIVHLVQVSVILLRYGFSEDVAIAGLLHDIVEDQRYPLDSIQAGFGPQVAEMVAALTERKQEAGVKLPWELRKAESLAQIREASDGAAAIKAADVLHNAYTLAACLRQRGPSIWQEFSRGPGPTLEYYGRITAVVRQRLGAHRLVEELEEAMQDLARAVANVKEPRA
mgnify:CR=1 FL=1